MSTILSCPACHNALRVPDELLGQKVRCPTCSDVFSTTAPLPAKAEDGGWKIEDRKEKPALDDSGQFDATWKELPLESSDEERSRPQQPLPESPGLVGAVEMKLSLDDDEPAPRASQGPPPESPPVRRPPPRLAEEDDDLKPCPACGKSIHYDARACPHCDEDLSDHRPRSRRRSRDRVRRDSEPHRGSMILTLGIISLVGTSFFPPIALCLGIAAWLMGHGDMKKIKARMMDPEGQGSTQAGMVCGIIGTALNALMSLCCLGYVGFIFSMVNMTPQTRPWMPPPKVTPAPPPMMPQWKDKGN